MADTVNRKLDDLRVHFTPKMIPNSIKIGAVTWKVIVKKMKDLGQCERTSHEIWISSEQPESGKETTFIHELLHAVVGVVGLDEGKHDEEEFIRRVEYTLYSTLKDNGFWPKD